MKRIGAYVWWELVQRVLNGEKIPESVLQWAIQEYPPQRMQILGSTFRYGKYYVPIGDFGKHNSIFLGTLISVLKRKAEKLGILDRWRLPHYRTYIYDFPFSFQPDVRYVEVDVTKAYMTVAWMEGLISDSLFERLLKMENGKELFLVALGSLQQVIIDIEVDENGIRFKKRPRVGYVYNYVARRFIDMTKDIVGIARWVDAWLVPFDVVDNIQEKLREKGFQSKVKGELQKVIAINVEGSENYWTVWKIAKGTESKRWVYYWRYLPRVPFRLINVKRYNDVVSVIQHF